jgi:uncharacterized protein (DUF58 family)
MSHGTWQTTGGSPAGIKLAAAALAAVIVASSAAAILAALAAVLWAIFAIVALVLVAVLAVGVWLIRRNIRADATVLPWQPGYEAWREPEPVGRRPQPAIVQNNTVNVFGDGLTGADIAAILDQQRQALDPTREIP